jgi:hypothetical protein
VLTGLVFLSISDPSNEYEMAAEIRVDPLSPVATTSGAFTSPDAKPGGNIF